MAQPPANQSCETCMFFIESSCRRKLPEALFPGQWGWAPCKPDDWCFYWKEFAPTIAAADKPPAAPPA